MSPSVAESRSAVAVILVLERRCARIRTFVGLGSNVISDNETCVAAAGNPAKVMGKVVA
jgi:hypothetical protein